MKLLKKSGNNNAARMPVLFWIAFKLLSNKNYSKWFSLLLLYKMQFLLIIVKKVSKPLSGDCTRVIYTKHLADCQVCNIWILQSMYLSQWPWFSWNYFIFILYAWYYPIPWIRASFLLSFPASHKASTSLQFHIIPSKKRCFWQSRKLFCIP